jgi:hypothetical protein
MKYQRQNEEMPELRVKNNLWEWHTRLEARAGHRISTRQAAIDMNIDERTLAAWFKDEIRLFASDIIVKLCAYYEREPSELFTLKPMEDETEPGQRVAVA